MSYYRPSFAQSTGGGMPRGGRGGSFSSSRGSNSYRGGSGRGNNSWNSSSNRGYHSTNSRGGSGNSAAYRSSGGYSGGSFDTSRSLGKYGGERLTFRGSSGGEESYRKPSYRPDTSYARESRLSPERKRMRTESRHDVYSSAGESSISSRYNADTSFGRSKQSLTSSTPFHRPSSSAGGGDFRKPLAPPPPPNISNSYSSTTSTRSGYRGGRISSRSSGGSRYIVNSRDTAPPRRLVDYTTTWRSSRGGTSIRSSEYARRLRLRQLTNRSTIIRSSRPIPTTSSRVKRNDSDDELWGAVRDDDEEDNDDDNVGTIEREPKEKNKDDDVMKMSVKKEVEEVDEKGRDEDEGKGDEKRTDDDGEGDGDAARKKKSPTKKVSSKDRERENSPDDSYAQRKQFIKLVCPYCHTRCITFSRYTNHLRSARHSAAMHHVALKQKTVLSRMRITQRAEQKSIERSSNESDLTTHTNFCPLCKLNYRQTKVVHRASKAHRDMKRFLMPVCKTCGITCKSPMLYETHCCSLEHIKRKAYTTTNGDKSDKSEHSGDDLQNYMTIDSVGDMDDIDMDLPFPPSVSGIKETFEGEIKSEGESRTLKVKNDKEKHTSSNKREREPQINVGVENIRKIEVHYCYLCRMYLPREEDVHDDLERILAKHCKQRTHMQRYIRYKEDKDLAKRAERLQRREMAEKEKEKDAKKAASKDDATINKSIGIDPAAKETLADHKHKSSAEHEESTASSLDETGDAIMKDLTGETELVEGGEKVLVGGNVEDMDVKEIQEADAEAETGDDKLWEDVDKDLGDILAGENKSCCGDEEEEDDDSMVNGERYDRFKYSEKNAKSGSIGKSQPVAAKKTEPDSTAAEKNEVEDETAK